MTSTRDIRDQNYLQNIIKMLVPFFDCIDICTDVDRTKLLAGTLPQVKEVAPRCASIIVFVTVTY